MSEEPYIPEFITVHLGAPGSEAKNIVVPFPEYIKNVAACEIYPTWPDSAVRAILCLQISHALHRCMSGWYRRAGYDFDITGSPVCDQTFILGHITFDDLNRIADEMFNSCICKKGSNEPFSFQNGGETDKLPSHWTVVALAESGMSTLEILQNILGDDVVLVSDIPVRIRTLSYPYKPLPSEAAGKNMRKLQIQLNRISRHYPAIPKINPADGRFNEQTQNALTAFRKIFRLSDKETVDSATGHRLNYLYAAVKRMSELHSLILSVEELPHGYPGILRAGDSGTGVRLLQVYLTAVGLFYPSCLQIKRADTFDQSVENAVIAYQKACNLEPDGIVDELTWLRLERAYNGITRRFTFEGGYPSRLSHSLRQGSIGDDVRRAQQYLSFIASTYPAIPKPSVTGLFGAKMVGAVRAFQREFEYPVTGVVDEQTWNSICGLYSDLTTGYDRQPGQSPGFALSQDIP